MRESVTVTINGELVADDKGAWEQQFYPKLNTFGVKYEVSGAYADYSSFVLSTRYNSQGSFQPSGLSCCSYIEFSRYTVNNDKVSSISIIRTSDENILDK